MNANEQEWASLSDLWRTSPTEVGPDSLRRLVASYRRRMAAVAGVEALVVGVFAWLSWVSIRDGVVMWEAVWLSTLWIFTAVAAPFAWWNRRGGWSAIGESVAEYRRQAAARRMRSLRFGIGLFVAEVVAVASQLAWFDRFTLATGATLAACAVPFGLWALWMKRRAAHELALSRGDD